MIIKKFDEVHGFQSFEKLLKLKLNDGNYRSQHENAQNQHEEQKAVEYFTTEQTQVVYQKAKTRDEFEQSEQE